MQQQTYAGLMSGTSLDAVDVVVADFAAEQPQLIVTHAHSFPEPLRQRLTRLIQSPAGVHLDELGTLHRELGGLYSEALLTCLRNGGLQPTDIAAAGCHGQTVRHSPGATPPFSLQLGCGATTAALSGVAIVNDFRSGDMALGGQGAPLVTAFHQAAFTADVPRVIVNIGGIANLTVLQPGQAVRAWDTGPGNTLLDAHSQAERGSEFDAGGAWAATGAVDEEFLAALLTDPYFSREAPKSTGREHFNRPWLDTHLAAAGAPPSGADLQATLAELTARTLAAGVRSAVRQAEVYICGGGAANADLCSRLARCLPDCQLGTTVELGIPPDWVEATAFAWLARARLTRVAGNVASATGAERPALLGAVHRS